MSHAPQSDWRGGRSQAESNVSKRVSRWFASLCALLLLGLLVWYLVQPFLYVSDTTFVMTVGVSGSDRLTTPPIEYHQETLDALGELPSFLGAFELETAASVRGLESQTREWISERSPDLAEDKTVLVVFVSAHGVVLDGNPYLLCGDYSIQRDSGRCSLQELLDEIAAVPAKLKLVVLDTGRLTSDARMGMLVNDFPRRVAREVERRGDPSLWVLCGNAPGERSSTDFAARRSTIGSLLTRALQGYADLEEEGGQADGKVSLSELYQYVLKTCHARSVDAAGRQTPVLLNNSSSPIPADAVADLALLNLAPSWQEELEGPAESADAPAEGDEETAAAAGEGAAEADAAAESDGASDESAESTAEAASDPSDSGDDPTTASDAAVADGVDAENESEFVARARRAWELRDALAQANWSPAIFAPQLWRAQEALLVDWEHRLRSGSAYRQRELNTLLNQATRRFEELLAAFDGRVPVERNDSFIGDRLINTWLRLEANPARRSGYLAAPGSPQAAAVKAYQKHLYRASDYVAWHSRACLGAENRLAEFDSISSLLDQLESFSRLIDADSQSNVTQLQSAASALQTAADDLERRFRQLAARAASTISDARSQRRAADLLSVPVLDAPTRMSLLAALESLPPGAETGVSQLGPISKEALAAPTLSIPTPQLARILEAIRLQQGLARLVDPAAAEQLEASIREVSGATDFSDRLADDIHGIGALLSSAYASFANDIRVEAGGGLSARDRLAMRVIDPRDVETSNPQSWDLATAVVPLPAAAVPKSQLQIARIDPFKLDLAEWQELRIDARAVGTEQDDLTAQLEFDGEWLEIRSGPRNEAVAPASSLRALLRPDQTASFVLSVRAKRERSANRQRIPLNVLVTDGVKLRDERQVDLTLPPPNVIDLVVRREGLSYEQHETATPDRIQVRPFPNRTTTYEFALRNRSERPRTVDVELLAIRRLRNATWAPGLIFETEALTSQLFDAGSQRVRSGVTVVAKREGQSLPADSEEWVPIEFGVEEPPAEDENAEEQPPKEPEAAPRHDISHGLACRITDPKTNKRWIKWIEVVPQLPSDFLEAEVRYDVRSEQIVARVRPSNSPSSGAADRPLSEILPGGLAEEAMMVRLHGVGNAQFGEINLDNPEVTLQAPAPPDGEPRFVELDVDGWPRAFGFSVVCSRTEDTVGRAQRRNRRAIRIKRIGLDGDATIYVTDPKLLEVVEPPAEGEAPPVPVLLPNDRIVRFRDRRELLRFWFEFQVDAPATAFVRRSGDDSVVLWRGSDNRQLDFYSDRQKFAWVTEVKSGWLKIESQVSDYRVQMSPEGRKDVPIEVEANLNLAGRSQATDRVTVLLDGQGPQLRRFTTVPPARSKVPIGDKIRVSLEFSDASGVEKLQYAFNPDGKLDTPVEITGAQVFKDGDRARMTFDLETTELKPGRWVLVGKAFDGLGNDFNLEPSSFAIVEPPPVVPPKLEITGVILLGSTDKKVAGAEVLLKQGETVVQKQTTGPDGVFRFQDLEEGTYDIAASARRRGFLYKSETPAVNAEPVPAKPLTIAVTD